MDSSTATTDERTPLAQIRRAETEITRWVAAAQRAAEAAVQEAQIQALDLKHQARETGRSEGQALYEESIAKAEEEARALVQQAFRRAETLCRQADLHKDDVVRSAVEIVIGQKEGATQHER